MKMLRIAFCLISCLLISSGSFAGIYSPSGSAGGAGSNSSVGAVGSAVPSDATQMGGTDGTNTRVPKVLNSSPSSTDYGMVVRPLNPNNVSHDSVDAGDPVKIGCHARTTTRTAVADADRADVLCDKNGKLVVTSFGARERLVRSGVITLSSTTETTLIAAGAAGVYRDLTYLKCTNSSASLVRVDLRDATAGTVIDSWQLAASGGGFNIAFSAPYAQASAANNWTVQLSAAVTDVRCSAQAIENN